MPLLRRITSVLCALLLVQLTLLEGYESCAAHVAPQEHARVAAMQVTQTAHTDASEPVRDDACNTEQMPSACRSMPSCANVLTLPVTAVAGTTSRLAHATLPEPAAIHSRPSAAPAAPPPRG
jgi:hypothetical protein